MGVSVVNHLLTSDVVGAMYIGAQTEPSNQKPTEPIAKIYGRFSHLARRVDSLDIAEQSGRAGMAEHVLNTVVAEIQQLASEERTQPSCTRNGAFDLEQIKRFGAAFEENLNARLEGRAVNEAGFRGLQTDDIRLLGRISEAMQLAELRNHAACVQQGLHDDKSTIEYLGKRYTEKLKELVVDESTVSVERPRAGLIRFFVSDAIFEALDGSGVVAAALASSAGTSENVSFTVYRSSLRSNSDYRAKNIPHETMHTYFGDAVAKVLGLERTAQDLEAHRDFGAFIFARYLDEGIAQAAGGVAHSFCAPLQHKGWEKFREFFIEHDREGFDRARGTLRELHNLFQESDFTTRMHGAGLAPLALVPIFLSAASLEDLRDRLLALHQQLPIKPPSPRARGGWGSPLET